MYDSGENESKKDTGPGCCFEIRWMAGQMGNGTFFCPLTWMTKCCMRQEIQQSIKQGTIRL